MKIPKKRVNDVEKRKTREQSTHIENETNENWERWKWNKIKKWEEKKTKSESKHVQTLHICSLPGRCSSSSLLIPVGLFQRSLYAYKHNLLDPLISTQHWDDRRSFCFFFFYFFLRCIFSLHWAELCAYNVWQNIILVRSVHVPLAWADLSKWRKKIVI